MFPRVHRLADSHPLGDWICDEFCIWDTEGIEPRGIKPPSHTVYNLNHSTNRVYTIGTECPHHMWCERSVPIVYTRLVEWLRSQTVWDGGLIPRGFDSKIHHSFPLAINWNSPSPYVMMHRIVSVCEPKIFKKMLVHRFSYVVQTRYSCFAKAYTTYDNMPSWML